MRSPNYTIKIAIKSKSMTRNVLALELLTIIRAETTYFKNIRTYCLAM